MKTKLLFLLFILTYSFCLQGCSDDDKAPADANENFITSATLTVGGKTYEAIIANNEITITVPYTVSLSGATVDLKYTPSAKILPEPTSITDWDNERIFRVTSYNGDEKQYTYRVIKDDIRQEGDVTLSNASEITAFAESGVTIIKGNLTIGTDDGEDIEKITELSKLKQVEGNIVIKNSYKGNDLTGLDNLTSIGGLYVGNKNLFSTSPLYQVSLEALTTVTGNVIICNNETKWIMTKALANVGGNVVINSSNLQSIQMEALSKVNGNFNIQSATDEDGDGVPELSGTMVSLALPELTSVGDTLSANYLASLKSINLEKLESAGAILFKTLPLTFETINLPAIQTVEGDLNISSSTTEIAIGSIVNRNETLTSFGGFSKLQKVGGTLTLANFINVTQLPSLTSITELGGYYLFHLDNAKAELDFSKTSFLKQGNNDCELRISYTPISKIKGKATMDCKLNLDQFYLKNALPDLEGIETINDFRIFVDSNKAMAFESKTFNLKKVIGNLYINGGISYGSVTPNLIQLINFPNLESVGGYFYLANSNISAPNLTTVGGQFLLKNNLTEFNLNKLETVGLSSSAEDISKNDSHVSSSEPAFYIQDMNTTILKIPALKKVGKKGLTIDVGGKSSTVTELNCPKLETVDGDLTIMGGLNPITRFLNKSLTTFSFPLLTKAASVTIKHLNILNDFTDFSSLFTNNIMEDGKWSVTKCAYNPTYQNMKDGQYKQP
ncbi:receptor L domain-containing protein [Bacteroides ihuae]|uniref:hypothetical protein n=1 Tax=Bacteroides ihuae TaxID=1852362 RepID=UPI0008DAF3FB|nr:hypothetical protein [Bacteroides ihuae]